MSLIRVDDELFPPEPTACLRCGTPAELRFAGPCPACTAELRATMRAEARAVDGADYVPTMHVTPNAVALKDE